jgi:hypothetical protein
MSVDQPPPSIIDPIGRSVWNVLCGAGGPMSKLNNQIDKIKEETKSVSDLNQTVIELNGTLKDTNSILRELLNKI